jgi:MFS family permease
MIATALAGCALAALAFAPAAALIIALVAVTGLADGPQLAAVFAVRQREAPARLRGQIFTTAASLKISAGALGAALAGALAQSSTTTVLVAAAAAQAAAVACYFSTSRTSGDGPASHTPAAPASGPDMRENTARGGLADDDNPVTGWAGVSRNARSAIEACAPATEHPPETLPS